MLVWIETQKHSDFRDRDLKIVDPVNTVEGIKTEKIEIGFIWRQDIFEYQKYKQFREQVFFLCLSLHSVVQKSSMTNVQMSEKYFLVSLQCNNLSIHAVIHLWKPASALPCESP